MLTREQIEARIAELEKEQARLIEAANRRLGEIAGALAVLKELLEEENA